MDVPYHVLHRLVDEKRAELERLDAQLKYQTGESEDRKDAIERMQFRRHFVQQELHEAEALLKYLIQHDEDIEDI